MSAAHWGDRKEYCWDRRLGDCWDAHSAHLWATSSDRQTEPKTEHCWGCQWVPRLGGQMEHQSARLMARQTDSQRVRKMAQMWGGWTMSRTHRRSRLDSTPRHPSRSGTRPGSHPSYRKTPKSRWPPMDRTLPWTGKCTHRPPNTRHTANRRSALTSRSWAQMTALVKAKTKPHRHKTARCTHAVPSSTHS